MNICHGRIYNTKKEIKSEIYGISHRITLPRITKAIRLLKESGEKWMEFGDDVERPDFTVYDDGDIWRIEGYTILIPKK
jgi:hypothetical protein